jgi:hypothetical protein
MLICLNHAFLLGMILSNNVWYGVVKLINRPFVSNKYLVSKKPSSTATWSSSWSTAHITNIPWTNVNFKYPLTNKKIEYLCHNHMKDLYLRFLMRYQTLCEKQTHRRYAVAKRCPLQRASSNSTLRCMGLCYWFRRPIHRPRPIDHLRPWSDRNRTYCSAF